MFRHRKVAIRVGNMQWCCWGVGLPGEDVRQRWICPFHSHLSRPGQQRSEGNCQILSLQHVLTEAAPLASSTMGWFDLELEPLQLAYLSKEEHWPDAKVPWNCIFLILSVKRMGRLPFGGISFQEAWGDDGHNKDRSVNQELWFVV